MQRQESENVIVPEARAEGGLLGLLHQEMDRQGIERTIGAVGQRRALGQVAFVPTPGEGVNNSVVPKWDPGRPYATWPQWLPTRQPSTGGPPETPTDPNIPERSRFGAGSHEASPANAVNLPRRTDGQATFPPLRPTSPTPDISHQSANEGDDWDRQDPIIEIFRRCVRAANRNKQAWQDFCDDLPSDARELHAVCNWQLNQSKPAKQNFCRARFTPN